MSEYFFLSKSKIIPSINISYDSASPAELRERSINDFYRRVNWVNAKAERVHLDVCDGEFVASKTLALEQMLSAEFKPWVNVHLMVKKPLEVLKKQSQLLRVHRIFFHKDSDVAPLDIIRFCEPKKIKVGLAIGPDADIETVKNYIEQIDSVLILTVKPGETGGKFLPDKLQKINRLREIGFGGKIIVDGGIDNETIKEAVKYFPDFIISGKYIFEGNSDEQTDRRFKELDSLAR